MLRRGIGLEKLKSEKISEDFFYKFSRSFGMTEEKALRSSEISEVLVTLEPDPFPFFITKSRRVTIDLLIPPIRFLSRLSSHWTSHRCRYRRRNLVFSLDRFPYSAYETSTQTNENEVAYMLPEFLLEWVREIVREWGGGGAGGEWKYAAMTKTSQL